MPYNLADLLAQRAHEHPSAKAVEYGGQAVTYRQLFALASERGDQFAASGILPGDRVAIQLPRGIEAAAAFFGAQIAGAVAVFVAESLRRKQIGHIVRHSQAKVVVSGGRLRQLLDGCKQTATIIDVAQPVEPGGAVPDRPQLGRDLAALIYTSGSTGLAKGVMLTHDNLLSGAAIVADYLQLTPDDRILSVLPWSFDCGLNQLLAACWVGATLVAQRSTFVPDICRSLSERKITGLAGVPPLWTALAGGGFLETPLSHLRYITNTGGVLPVATIERIRRAHPSLELFLMYGLTEAFRSSYLSPHLVDAHPTSIGQAIPNTEILVIDEMGRECRPGEVGELVHRGPTVAAGYWRDPEATARVFRPHPSGLPGATTEYVVYSGDYVRREPDGLLYYEGRRDDLFKSRGVRVTPTEVEAGLLDSGLVAEAVVCGVPDGAGDTVVLAAVVPTAVDFDLATLTAYCRSELPPHQQPERIVAMPALPRTPSGKVDRAAVKRSLADVRSAATAEAGPA